MKVTRFHHVSVNTAVGELEALGIDDVREAGDSGGVQVWITGPAGNTVELQQDTAAL